MTNMRYPFVRYMLTYQFAHERQKLVQKSKGSFLWTRLIVEELRNYWTDDDIEQVLSNVPGGKYADERIGVIMVRS